MKLARALAVGAIAAAFAVGCSDSTGSDDDVTIGDLVGTWTATEFRYTNQADRTQSVDVVALLGAEMVMTVSSNGNFTGTLQETAVSPVQSVSGTMAVDGDTMTLTFTLPASLDEPVSGTFTLTTGDPDVLRMNATSGVDFDFSVIPQFGGDPGEVPADLTLEMER